MAPKANAQVERWVGVRAANSGLDAYYLAASFGAALIEYCSHYTMSVLIAAAAFDLPHLGASQSDGQAPLLSDGQAPLL